MIQRRTFAIATLVMAPLAIFSGAAFAQSTEIEPNDGRLRPPEIVPEEPTQLERPMQPERRLEAEDIGEDEAVRIARDEGMVRIERIREGRRGWVIVGIDHNGDDMRIILNHQGEIIDIQRE
ncbi:hypothetical protein [Bosea sp. (in: a-proteobacteria)]|jgi:hypothetical protein|uniref:hypothetical protein n=1 Tax=Bosea sp. (in: a-proteobacteria) TaxID=1871050 RepID=UPI003F6F8B54